MYMNEHSIWLHKNISENVHSSDGTIYRYRYPDNIAFFESKAKNYSKIFKNRLDSNDFVIKKYEIYITSRMISATSNQPSDS